MNGRTGAGMAGLLLAAVAVAQPAPEMQPVGGKGFVDRLEQRPAVSGSGIAGVMLVGSERPARRQSLWIRCFGDCTGRIQIMAKSASAGWQGTGLFEWAGPKTDRWIRVPLAAASPEAAAVRSGLPDEAIAVLARRVDARNIGLGPALLLAAWSADEKEPSGDIVQVSLTARQKVTARPGSGPPIACRRIAEPQPRGFTHVCRMPLADVARLPRILVEQDDGGSIQPNPIPLG